MSEERKTSNDDIYESNFTRIDNVSPEKFFNTILRRKKIIFSSFLILFTLTSFITITRRIVFPTFQGSFSLLIDDPLSDSSNKSALPSSNTVFDDLVQNTTKNDITTLIELLKSRLVLVPLAEKYSIKIIPFTKMIDIRSGGDNKRSIAKGILKISVEGNNKKKTLQITKDLSKAYQEVAIEQRQQKLSDGLKFLNKQAPVLESKTIKIQKQLADFREKNKLIEPSREGESLKKREFEIKNQILVLESELNRLSKVKEKINEGELSARGFKFVIGNDNKPIANEGLSISDSDQELLELINSLESELALARSKFKPSSTMVIGLEAKLENLLPILKKNQIEALDSAMSLTQGRIKNNLEQLAVLQDKFKNKPRLISEYETLVQNLKIARKNFIGLVDAREKIKLEIAQNSYPWKIISPPELLPYPLSPQMLKSFALGILFSSFFSVIIGFVRERLDYVFHNAEEVIDSLNKPLLAQIPYVEFFKGVRENKRFLISELDNVVAEKNSKEENDLIKERFFYQESFRNLSTSLKFASSDKKIKSIVITSSIPSEGKSLISILLAKTLSEIGQKILLIDCDLRKPQLHHRLGLNNLRGFSNLLVDKKLKISDVINKVENYENWQVITSGIKPPDPTKLLNSQRVESIINEFVESENYDLVIFDSTPVLGLSDSLLISQYCDGLVLIVGLDKVNKKLPKEALNIIKRNNSNLLGVVTNSFKKPERISSSYAYQYNDYFDSYADIDPEKENKETLNKFEILLIKRLKLNYENYKSYKTGFISRFSKFMNWLDNK